MSKRLLYPLLIFLLSVVALGLSLFLYIYWYMAVSSRLQGLIKRFHLEGGQFRQLDTWVVIVILSLLVALILGGIFTIFVYNLKSWQLNRLQNNFLNNFTHELKTPVTSIKLYLETFKKHDLPREKQLKYIDYMIKDVARLDEHINRILNLAKIESGVYDCHLRPVDLESFVRAFIAKNRYLFPHCQINYHHHPHPHLIAKIDPSLFAILLMNLLTNAAKYNRAASAEVVVSLARQGKKISLACADNGIGLARPELKKIFKKFYRVKNEESGMGGSGLGLYLVERIAKIHRGRISAASPGLDQGTTFTLLLPAQDQDWAGEES